MARGLFLLLLLFVPSWRVLACQCGAPPSLEQAFKDSPLVITGVVLAQHPAALSRDQFRESHGSGMPRWFPVTKVEIGVTRVYKGNPPEKIVLTHIGCCVCEETLETGKEYALFVQPSWNVPQGQMVSFCDPNTDLAQDHAVLQRLGSPGRVLPRGHFKRTVGEAFGYGLDRVRNVAVRTYLARVNPNRWVQDPVARMTQSPWYGYAKALGVGAVLGMLVVLVRRRVRGTRGA